MSLEIRENMARTGHDGNHHLYIIVCRAEQLCDQSALASRTVPPMSNMMGFCTIPYLTALRSTWTSSPSPQSSRYAIFTLYTSATLSAELPRTQPNIFQDNQAWCTGCNQSTGGICRLYTAGAAANIPATSVGSSHHDAVSPIGAGFIGFAVTLAVFLAALAVLGALGVVSFGVAAKRRPNQGSVPLKASSFNSHQG